LEIPSTTVFFPTASWLNLRKAVEHVEVSRLGKMFRMTLLPSNSYSDMGVMSDFISLNSGALVPFSGRLPEVFTGLPFNVTFAIFFFYQI